jgi:DNA topoisomerase-1
VGLRHVSDGAPGIRRKRAGAGFFYLSPTGVRISDALTIRRLRSIAAPPAWTDVWFCPSPDGHIQATGRDARGRKQYRYHPTFRGMRETAKFDHLFAFVEVLPTIRDTIAAHMAQRRLAREKVLATVVHLLEMTLIRVGNDEYARQNKSYGLTTLKNRHVAIEGSEVRFRFTGKSGKLWSLKVRDRRVAKIVRACQELPGQDLLQYFDDDGKLRSVTSSDVNCYLREIAGREVTAKDFRTWAGTIGAARALDELGMSNSETEARRNIRAAVERVSVCLGNTPTICRKCYIHPEVLNAYLEGDFVFGLKLHPGGKADREIARLGSDEAALLAMLRSRPAQGATSTLAGDLAKAARACGELAGKARLNAQPEPSPP